MALFIIGVVVAFNFLVIYVKFTKNRISDAILDVSLLTIVSILFGGSYAGLVVATVASAIISIYLFFSPPKIKFPKPP